MPFLPDFIRGFDSHHRSNLNRRASFPAPPPPEAAAENGQRSGKQAGPGQIVEGQRGEAAAAWRILTEGIQSRVA